MQAMTVRIIIKSKGYPPNITPPIWTNINRILILNVNNNGLAITSVK